MTRAACLLMLALFGASLPGLAQEAQDPALVIESVQCRGNVATSCGALLKNLYLGAGDRVDEEEIANARLRLAWLPNLESVDIYLEKGSERGKAVVVVEVAEGNAITTEVGFGFASRSAGSSLQAAGRIHNWNLFGEGKVLRFGASVEVPLDAPERRGHSASIEYVDPQLFGSKQYFLSGSVFYHDSNFQVGNGDRGDFEFFGAQMVLGRRLWDFSFVQVGWQERPIAERDVRFFDDDGNFVFESGTPSGLLLFGFGWHTEDDPYFPTSGSWLNVNRVSSSHEDQDEEWSLFYRRTWRTRGNSILQLRYQNERNISLAYARPLFPRGGRDSIRRARWYIEPTFNALGHDAAGDWVYEAGVRAGIRLDTQAFGIVEFALFVTDEIE